jgi:phosphoserine phosphatase RsbU/P
LDVDGTRDARILLADDQTDVLAALRLLLKSEGFLTESVTSPAEALDSVREQIFDLVLMDLNYTRDTTSGHEGLELLAQIQSVANPPPIVVMTAWGSIELAVEAMQRGARDFVPKPWENERLLETVRKHLKGRPNPYPKAGPPERDLSIAKRVQQKLLPQSAPELRTLEYAAYCVQAGAIGGDYYDFIRTGEGRVMMVLADVSGKGIPAALLMANLQATLRTHCERRFDNLAALARAVNRHFYDSTSPEHFATAFLAEYEDRSRTLRYVNCGHNAPLLIRTGGEVETLDPTGTVIGAFTPYRSESNQVQLESGDLLVVCSDGVLEARNTADEEYGSERLARTVRENNGLPIREIPPQVAKSVADHSCFGQEDDLTLLTARSL